MRRLSRAATSLLFAALLNLLFAAAAGSPAAAGPAGGPIAPRIADLRTQYRMNYQGPYNYGLAEVPRFRWGYFGTHTRPTTSWYRGYSRDFRQWTFQPGN